MADEKENDESGDAPTPPDMDLYLFGQLVDAVDSVISHCGEGDTVYHKNLRKTARQFLKAAAVLMLKEPNENGGQPA